MSTAYAPPPHQPPPHGTVPPTITQHGPQHHSGPPSGPPGPPGPGMPPPQHGATPNGVPLAPQRPSNHPGQQNPQNIQRVSLQILARKIVHKNAVFDNCHPQTVNYF